MPNFIFLKHALWFAAFVAAQSLLAQVQDDFSDGNLDANPAWQGDAANFIVNAASELQLNAPAAGASALFLPVELADSNIWELDFRLEFDPSASNKLLIYLQSDSPALTGGSGYFLAIGKDGSADDLEFFRQDAGAPTLLAASAGGSVATSPEVRLRMTRIIGGNWALSADLTGGANLQPLFEVQDATYPGGNSFFGFHCTYTATRKDKFFFDDVLVAPLLPDTEAPVLLSASPLSAIETDVLFNEALDPVSAADPSNYTLSGLPGEPALASPDATNPALVHLTLGAPLASFNSYQLTATGVSDPAGNAGAAQTVTFEFVEISEPEAFDVLISEIMADPSPVVGLPEVEFIELHNPSGKAFNLQGWGFSSGSVPQIFPAKTLLPSGYLIVCDDSDADSLAAFGEVVTLTSFPALTNGGDLLTLTDASGNVLHRLGYMLDWYGDAQKAEGGWTLEMVNPLAPCLGSTNWRAAANLVGGTPGQPNSVLSAMPDDTPPLLLRVFADDAQPDLVTLFFNKKMSPASAENVDNFSVSNGVQVVSATLLSPGENGVQIQVSPPLEVGTGYEISAQSALTDCRGVPAGTIQTLFLALPESPENQDIVINEILFNPASGGVDFLEIFNRSSKIFNLADLVIGNIRTGLDTLTAAVEKERLFFPGEHIVFTEGAGNIAGRYLVQDTFALIVNDLPSFNDDAGNVTLYRVGAAGEVVFLDAFDYSEDLHSSLLNDPEGVSLERISPNAPTQTASNWHSAASAAGYATPTYRNSQFVENQSLADDFIEIPEPKLSPDGDGFQDFLLVNYRTDQPGFAARASIFDAEGRLVKTLLNNELLGSEGFFRWDGDTDRGDKARLGIYVVWIQLVHPEGTVREFKKTCVVAGRL